MNDKCPNCKREIELTKHHLIPKTKKGKNVEENYFYLCEDCHAQLHILYCNSFLRDVLDSEEAILSDQAMRKFGMFAGKQHGRIKKKLSNEKRKFIKKN